MGDFVTPIVTAIVEPWGSVASNLIANGIESIDFWGKTIFAWSANLCATVVGGDNVRRTTARVVQPGAKHTLGLQQAWTGIQRHVPQQ